MPLLNIVSRFSDNKLMSVMYGEYYMWDRRFLKIVLMTIIALLSLKSSAEEMDNNPIKEEKRQIITNTESYHFKLGKFKCIVVSDGIVEFDNPAGMLFPKAPKEQLDQILLKHNINSDQWKSSLSPWQFLLIDTGQKLVLLDTGVGDGFDPAVGKLVRNLQNEGIKPEDINVVIFTHAHLDHVGGVVNSKWDLVFPNARYMMWKSEWEFWTSEANLTKMDELSAKFAREKLPPIQSRIDLIDHEMEVLPGIRCLSAPGHTVGHMIVSITSAKEQMLCFGDAFPHPISVERPEWYSYWDNNPEQTVITRKKLLELAVSEKALIFACHLPFPGLGHIFQKGTGYEWQPIHLDDISQ
jgi:glyoxylase-like metal-dependent hydrolase (beta-lactamase superfamily II)